MGSNLHIGLSFTADTKKAKAELEGLTKQIEYLSSAPGIRASFTGSKDEILAAQKALQGLNTALKAGIKISDDYKKIMSFNYRDFSESMKKMGLTSDDLKKAFIKVGPEAERLFANLAKTAIKADAPLKKTNEQLSKMWETMQSTVRWQISSSVLHGLMSTISGAYSYAKRLNGSLNDIRIVTGQSASEMKDFAEYANNAAKALHTSTNEYAKASLIYYQQGLPDEEAKERAETTIKLAQVSRQTAEETSDQLTAIWNNFYKEGGASLEHYADVLTSLGAETASSTAEIANGLQKFAAVGDMIGLSYDYAATALATITATTRQSEDVVGTALKTIFARIQGLNLGETLEDGTSLNKYSEALDKIGINIFDTSGQLKAMDTILNEMGSSWKNLTKDQQVATAQTVAGMRQYNQLVALMEHWDFFQSNLSMAQHSQGALDEQQEIYAESWEAASARVEAALEGIYGNVLDDNFFISLTEGLASVTEMIDGLIESLNGMPGVLNLISSLMLKIFSEQASNSIDNLAYSINQWNGANARQQMEEQEAFHAQYKDIVRNWDTQEADAMLEGFESRYELQKKLLAVSEDLTEEEKKRYAFLLDVNEALHEEVALKARQKQEAAERSTEEIREKVLNRIPTADGIDFSRLKDTLIDALFKNIDLEPGITPENFARDFDLYQNMVKQDGTILKPEKGIPHLAYDKFFSLQKDKKLFDKNQELNIQTDAQGNFISAKGVELPKTLVELLKVTESQFIGENGRIQNKKNGHVFQQASEIYLDFMDQFANSETDLEKEDVLKTFFLYLRDAKLAKSRRTAAKIVKKELDPIGNKKLPAEEIDSFVSNIFETLLDEYGLGLDYNKAKEDAKNSNEGLSGSLEEAAKKVPTFGKNVVRVAGDISNLSFGLVTLKGAFDNLTNNDLSWWDKLLSVTTSLTFALPSLGSAILDFEKAHNEGIFSDMKKSILDLGANTKTGLLDAIHKKESKREEFVKGKTYNEAFNLAKKNGKNDDEAKAEALSKIAEQTERIHEKSLILKDDKLNLKGILKLLGPIAKKVAGIAAAAMLVYIILKQIHDNSPEERLKRLNDQLEASNKRLNNVNNRLTQQNELFEKLKDGTDIFKGLEKGSVKWTQALAQNNAEIQKIIRLYPDLVGKNDILIDKTTKALSLSDSSIEAIEKRQVQELVAAQNAASFAQIAVDKEKRNQTWDSSYFGEAPKLATDYDAAYLKYGDAMFDKDMVKEIAKEIAENHTGSIEQNQYEKYIAEQIVKNQEKIRSSASLSNSIDVAYATTGNSLLSGLNSNRNLEDFEKLIDKDFQQIVQENAEKQDFHWQDHFNYKEGDKEWDDIQKFIVSTYGDEAKYVAQHQGNMVVDINGEEIEISQEEFENYFDGSALVNTFSSELKTAIATSLSEASDDSTFSKKFFLKFQDESLIALDNFKLSMDQAFGEGAGEERSNTLFDAVLNANNGNEEDSAEVLEQFATSLGMIDLSSAENIRKIDQAIHDMSVDGAQDLSVFTEALNELNTEAVLSSMDHEYAKISEKYGFGKEGAEDLEDYALHLADIAKESDQLSDSLATDAESAADLATEIMRMNKGVEDLNKNYEEWISILTSSSEESQEYASALGDVKRALADILDTEAYLISSDFVKNHLTEIEKAAQGDADAIDSLHAAMGEEIISRVKVGLDENAAEEVDSIHSQISELIGEIDPNIEVGAELSGDSYSNLLESLNSMVEAAGMSADEINAYLSSVGYEPVYSKEEVPVDTTVGNFQQERTLDDISFGGDGWVTWNTTTKTTSLPSSKVGGSVEMVGFSGKGTPPEIKGIRKTAPGSMNNRSSSNPGGKSSGKKPKKAKLTKKNDIVERYKEINDQLDNVKDALEDVNKETDRLYGPNRLAAMQDSIDLLEKERDLIVEKRKENARYIAQDKANLKAAGDKAGLNFKFAKDGTISNYTKEMEKLYKTIHDLEVAANADGNVTDAEQAELDKWYRRKDNVKDAIKNYDDSRELGEDLENEEQDNLNKQQDIKYEKIKYKVEYKLEMNEDEMSTIDYFFSRTEDNIFKSAEGFVLLQQKLGPAKEDLGIYRQEQQELDRAFKAGEISEAAYHEGLKEVQAGYISSLEGLTELDAQMTHYYEDTLTAANEELEKHIALMEHGAEVLDSYQTLVGLLQGEEDYDSLGIILEGKAESAEAAFEVAKKANDEAQAEADALRKKMNDEKEGSEAFEAYKEDWMAAQEIADQAENNMLEKSIAWAEAQEAIFENTLAKKYKSLEELFTGGSSFDELNKKMSHAQTMAEHYLTTTNKIYETNKLIRTAQIALDENSSEVSRQKLQAFIEETKMLQQQGKLSKFDLEVQQKKYNLLVAKIALEEAQKAKSKARLSRDANGNYGYVFTADEEKIADLEQKYADAENDLYNTRLKGANDYAEKYNQTMQQMYEELREAAEKYGQDSEEYARAAAEIQARYFEQLEAYGDTYNSAVKEDVRVQEDAWSSGFNENIQNAEKWKNGLNQHVDEVFELIKENHEKMKDIADKAGVNIKTLQRKVKDITNEVKAFGNALTKKGGLIDDLADTVEEVRDLTERYIKQRDRLQDLIKKYEKYLDKLSAVRSGAKKTVTDIRSVTNAYKAQAEAIEEASDAAAGYSSGNGSGTEETNKDLSNANKDKNKDKNKGTKKKMHWQNRETSVYVANVGESGFGLSFSSKKIGDHRYYEVEDGKFVRDTEIQNAHPVYSHGAWKYDVGYYKYYDTGGYTGEWGPEGKLAVLHQKEIVLNKHDTENMLSMLEVTRSIMNTISSGAKTAMQNLVGLITAHVPVSNNQSLEQQVHIDATFPNVTNHNEIEQAFKNLADAASQYAHRK